ncbi:MAG: membrane-bound lytic murein transglycosylase MltF [Halobacteriovoraceae bacterium]|nr:membrane-bound lytic murein transglycosylase MltF [Halobacteriovoraceae bacterium]
MNRAVICLCLTILLVSCNKESTNFLRVGTLYSTTSYYKDDLGKESGFEYELVKGFAASAKLDVEFELYHSMDELLEDLKLGKINMAAAGLTITEERKKSLVFSTPYLSVSEQVVCGKRKVIKKKSKLENLKLVVLNGSSHEGTLLGLKKDLPKLDYKALDDSSEGVLEELWKNRELCTVVDSNILAVHRRYFPELRVVFEFSEQSKLAWAFGKESGELKEKADQWIAEKEKTFLANLKNKYYGHLKDFDYYDTKKFLERMETRLPQYKKYFKEAAKSSALPWDFLAAVSYQESQWNEKAVSPTGVRGLMMLTQATAKEVGVKKRTDPEQSIKGGARYLRKQLDRLPEYIRFEDRRWFALASYNVGYYHLRDGMALSVLQNKDPGSWAHLKRILPLLTKKKYYKNLRYGYARGLEPVIYVKRIRNYLQLLKSHVK